MARLSAEDEAFLLQHNIPLSSTFDASGMRHVEWRAAMKAAGKTVAYGVTCRRGHSLKDRWNHCIRCNPAAIDFGSRASKDGFVYLARSKNLALLKVGFSERPSKRLDIANREGYAGANDWQVEYWIHSLEAGRVEIELHARLKVHEAPQIWVRNGVEQTAQETYSCELSVAIAALQALERSYNCVVMPL